MSHEWDAARYHVVSDPQVEWGKAVLSTLDLRGDETVIDAGCGTGRLTALVMERLPRGRVLAVDCSRNMLEAARAELARFGERVRFVEADLADLPEDVKGDAVFSTATFHWVTDHDWLFVSLFRALAPGGRLVAQCGGEGNLDAFLRRTAEEVARRGSPKLDYPAYFAPPGLTSERLSHAGFEEVEAWLTPAPTTFPDAEAYRAFVSTVILPRVLERFADEADRRAIVDALVERASRDQPPLCLDYVRLWMRATRPFARMP